MSRITGRVPEEYMKKLNSLVENGDFPSASEAIRYALNILIDGRVPSVLKRLYHEKH